MKVLNVSTLGYGGAAIAARRLHKSLLNKGVTSEILTKNPGYQACEGEVVFQNGIGTKQKLRKFAQRAHPKTLEHRLTTAKHIQNPQDPFTSIYSGCDIVNYAEKNQFDIINLHWTANFLDWPSFFNSNKLPVVWSLCDLAPFTGGCHYTDGCDKFSTLQSCQQCPKIGNGSYAAKILEIKKRLENRRDFPLCFVAPADATRKLAQNSVFSKAAHVCIPHLTDTDNYFPMDQADALHALGLSRSLSKKTILLYVGPGESHRKGGDLFKSLVEQFPSDTFHFIQVGGSKGDTKTEHYSDLGVVTDEKTLNHAYNAASAVLIPSREDNLPLVFIDAQTTGTPCISFPTSGIINYLDNGVNGITAELPTSVANLKVAIRELGKHKNLANAQTISSSAISSFGPDTVATQYLELYQQLLEGSAIDR